MKKNFLKIILAITAIAMLIQLPFAAFAEAPAEEPKLFTLYDPGETKPTTGWWNNGPFVPELDYSVGVDVPVWFNGLQVFLYASNTDAPAELLIVDEDDNIMYDTEFATVSNKTVSFNFDKKIAPGYYYIHIITLEPEDVDSTHLVIGSGTMNPDLELEISSSGYKTNGDTKTAPYIALYECEADAPAETAAPADATESPADATEAPADATEAPADATEAPADATEAPADATEAPADPTEAPADPTKAPADKTDAPKDEKSGCGSVVTGGAAVLVLAAAALLRKKEY